MSMEPTGPKPLLPEGSPKVGKMSEKALENLQMKYLGKRVTRVEPRGKIADLPQERKIKQLVSTLIKAPTKGPTVQTRIVEDHTRTRSTAEKTIVAEKIAAEKKAAAAKKAAAVGKTVAAEKTTAAEKTIAAAKTATGFLGPKRSTERKVRENAERYLGGLRGLIPISEEQSINVLSVHDVRTRLNSKDFADKLKDLELLDRNIIGPQNELDDYLKKIKNPNESSANIDRYNKTIDILKKQLQELYKERTIGIHTLYNELFQMLQDCGFVALHPKDQKDIFRTINNNLRDKNTAYFISSILRKEIAEQQFESISKLKTLGSALYAQFASSMLEPLVTEDGKIGKLVWKRGPTEHAITDAFTILFNEVPKLQRPALKIIHTEYMNAMETSAREKQSPFPENEAIKELLTLFSRSVVMLPLQSLTNGTEFAKKFMNIASLSPSREAYELYLEPKLYELATSLVNRGISSKSPIATFISRRSLESLDIDMKVLKELMMKTKMANPRLTEFERRQSTIMPSQMPFRQILANDFDIIEELVGPRLAARLLPEKIYFGILDLLDRETQSVDQIAKYLEQYKPSDVRKAFNNRLEDIKGAIGTEKANQLKNRFQ